MRFQLPITLALSLALHHGALAQDVTSDIGKAAKGTGHASHAQAIKAQAGLVEASLDYLLARDELTRALGRTSP